MPKSQTGQLKQCGENIELMDGGAVPTKTLGFVESVDPPPGPGHSESCAESAPLLINLRFVVRGARTRRVRRLLVILQRKLEMAFSS